MADIVTSRIFTDGERGITAQKLNDIVGSSVIQPAFYTSKPTAPSADPADIALILKAGAYAQVPISALAGSATQAQIWDTRLRSYNSVQNCNFEVDQQNCGAAKSNVPLGGRMVDRWLWGRGGSHQINSQQWPFLVNLPGTSFMVSQSPLTVTIATAQATLAAGDSGYMYQTVEGPMLRELLSDVHSVSILIRSTTANVKFSYFIQDAASAHSYTKLCTIPVANTWTLITIPNIPVFSASATWSLRPGTVGCLEGLTFGCGTTYVSSTDGAWVNAGVLASPGTTNWFANATGNEIDIAFVQHEPGGVCTTLMDKPFSQNYNECLRYYCKSYDYDVKPGIITYAGVCSAIAYSTGFVRGGTRYPVPMAKTPTVTTWTPNNATAGAALDDSTGLLVGCSPSDVGKAGLGSLNNGSAGFIAGHEYSFHYTADTGW